MQHAVSGVELPDDQEPSIRLDLREALEVERKEPSIVMEASGDPLGDLPIQAHLAEHRPRKSVVQIRPWLLPEPVGQSDRAEVADEPDSRIRDGSNHIRSRHFGAGLPWSNLRSTHWSFHLFGCAMSLRNSSAMRSPGVSASNARTNLPAGSMT